MENKKENGYNIICGRNPVLEAVRSGKSKAVPLEEVMKQYGLAD